MKNKKERQLVEIMFTDINIPYMLQDKFIITCSKFGANWIAALMTYRGWLLENDQLSINII